MLPPCYVLKRQYFYPTYVNETNLLKLKKIKKKFRRSRRFGIHVAIYVRRAAIPVWSLLGTYRRWLPVCLPRYARKPSVIKINSAAASAVNVITVICLAHAHVTTPSGRLCSRPARQASTPPPWSGDRPHASYGRGSVRWWGGRRIRVG